MADKTLPELIDALQPMVNLAPRLIGALAKLDEVLRSANDAVNVVAKYKSEAEKARAEYQKHNSAAEDQRKRAEEAKEAAAQIVDACRAMADKAKADKAAAERELAARMHEMQVEQGRKQAEMAETLKQYQAQINDARAEARREFEVERTKQLDEIASKKARVAELQEAYNALKAKFA